jgi:cyclohexadienyl dehydratase
MSKAALWLCFVVAWGCSAGAGSRAAPAGPLEPPTTHSSVAGGPSRGLTELRVGTSGDYAPFSQRDAAGQLRGFDVEIAEQLAADLGLEVRWVPFRWPELKQLMQDSELDVAMGGITWQPARAVIGYMTRAVARGGPCVLGDAAAKRVAVNQGGVLEPWARARFPDRELVTVSDNTSLPALLAEGRAGAIVTDSFELQVFMRPGWASHCEPPLWRKVYWVGPRFGAELGARIDGWLRQNAARLLSAHERWLGAPQRLDAATHLTDLMARRFAFMPLVAGAKAARGLPIEDVAREREVLDATARDARELGLPERAVVELFALQIELSKAVQRRQSETTALDLATAIRPALSELGERILEALVEARAERQLTAPTPADLELLSPWLTPEERTRLLASLQAALSEPP